MHHYLAQVIKINGQQIKGPLGPGFNTISDVSNRVVTVFVIPVAALILFGVFLWGGYDYLLSQGSPDKLKSAQAKITTGIIGFVLLLVAYLVVRILSNIFGIGQGLF